MALNNAGINIGNLFSKKYNGVSISNAIATIVNPDQGL